MLEAETICVRQAAAGQRMRCCKRLDSELQFLQQLCGLTLDELFRTATGAGAAAGVGVPAPVADL